MSLVESAGGTGTWPTNAGAVTTGTITPASGDLLVAIAVCGNGDNAAATAIAMSGTGAMSGTWTLLAHLYLTTGPMAAVFAKDAGASPSSGTATATFSSPVEGSGLIVRRFAGAAAAASQTGVTATAGSAGGGVYAKSITPGTTGSRVVGGFADSSNSISLTANAATSIYNQGNGSAGDTLAAFEASSASTAATPVTLGFTNTGTDSTAIALVEILPSAGVAVALTAPNVALAAPLLTPSVSTSVTLTAPNVALAAPLAAPAPGQSVALTAPNLALAAPLVAPSAGGTVALTAPGAALAAPLLTPGAGSAVVALTTPNVALAAPAVTPFVRPAFPQSPLDLRCELNLAGTYTDVSGYVYQREGTSPPVNISRGRPDESSQANPATCTWEWNNRDGRFSPRNPLSPYFGQLGRNTPVRWSVPAQVNYLRMETTQARAYVNDTSAIDITGSIEMRIALRLSDWQGAILACKWDGGGCWAWQLNPAGTMTFWWFDASVNVWSVTSAVPVPYTSGDMALRVTMDASTGNVAFYTAATIDGAYAQLGTTASGTGGAPTSIQVQHVSALAVGFSFDFKPAQVFGRLYEYRLYNGIASGGTLLAESGGGLLTEAGGALVTEVPSGGGTVVADAVFTSLAAGTTTWTDSAGRTWNLAGGAEISSRNYRGHFEMSAQPPKWDVTGADQAVMAAAGGPLRRLSQGTANAMSAMKRAVLQQTGTLAPQAYWTLEDAAGASVFGASAGGLPMTFDASPAPNLATDSSFLASAPLPTLNGSRLYGSVSPYTSGGAAVVRWLAKLGTITLLPGLTYAPLMRIATSGTVRVLYVVAGSGGTLGLIGYDATGATVVNTGLFAFGAAGVPLWYSAEIQLVAGNVQCSLVTLAPGASSGSAITATLSGGTVGNVTQVALNPNSLFTDTVVGHVTLQSTWSTLFALGQPLNAWTGETAGARYARLAGENGYQARILGSPGQSAPMGPQAAATLATLLAEVELADLGQQFEPRQALAIGYRTLASMLNQAPAVTLDYSASQPGGVNGNGADSGLDPTYDDLLLANDWTVTRGSSGGSQGATWQAQLNDGSAMSISDPPTGIGDYAKTATANVQYDSQLPDSAGWQVHAGTVDQARWPQVPVNLVRTEIQNASLYYPVLDADVGDYLELLNLPDIILYDPVKQLLFGTKEGLGGFHHTVEWAAVPEVAYEVAVFDDPVYGRADTDGSSLAAGATSSATTLSVSTTGPSGILWTTSAADFPFDIAVAGERMTVTNVTGGSSPQSFTVTRSVNGVVKAQSSGADVRLWFPPILSLA